MGKRDDVDTGRVAGIVEAKFPQLRPVAATYLGEGYDSSASEVNGEWVFTRPCTSRLSIV